MNPFQNLKHDLQILGFEQGLGNTAGSIIESLEQLDNLNADTRSPRLERFSF